jgi:hypothetical protein
MLFRSRVAGTGVGADIKVRQDSTSANADCGLGYERASVGSA